MFSTGDGPNTKRIVVNLGVQCSNFEVLVPVLRAESLDR